MENSSLRASEYPLVCSPFEGKPEENIPRLDRLAGNDAVALDYADDKARQVVFIGRIKARHLGGFSADQGATVVLAGIGDAGNHLLGNLRVKLADGEVVHEEKRSSALHGDVVDAVVNQVAADGVMNAHVEGNLQLCSHAVNARNQHGIFEFLACRPGRARQTRQFR